LVEHVLQGLDLLVDSIESSLLLVQLRSLVSQNLLSSFQLLSKRPGFVVDFVEVKHGLHPEVKELDGV